MIFKIKRNWLRERNLRVFAPQREDFDNQILHMFANSLAPTVSTSHRAREVPSRFAERVSGCCEVSEVRGGSRRRDERHERRDMSSGGLDSRVSRSTRAVANGDSARRAGSRASRDTNGSHSRPRACIAGDRARALRTRRARNEQGVRDARGPQHPGSRTLQRRESAGPRPDAPRTRLSRVHATPGRTGRRAAQAASRVASGGRSSKRCSACERRTSGRRARR